MAEGHRCVQGLSSSQNMANFPEKLSVCMIFHVMGHSVKTFFVPSP